MITHILWAAAVALAAPQNGEILPYGSLENGGRTPQDNAPFGLRSVFEAGAVNLEARQGCQAGYTPCGSDGCMPATSTCCSNGRSCRAGTDCVEGGCCLSGNVPCDATDGSGYEGCYPASEGASCCSNGRFCRAGTYCATGGCCRDGQTCNGGGTGGTGGTGGGGSPDGVTPPTPFTPNPNPRKAGLGGQASKPVDLYWEAAYMGLWYEYQAGQCDKTQKAKLARGPGNTITVDFEDDVRGFAVSVTLGDVGNVRVASGGISQNITILSTGNAAEVAAMDTCPVSYQYIFPQGTAGYSLSIDYLSSDTGLADRNSGEFLVHQITIFNSDEDIRRLTTTSLRHPPQTLGANAGGGGGAGGATGGAGVPVAAGTGGNTVVRSTTARTSSSGPASTVGTAAGAAGGLTGGAVMVGASVSLLTAAAAVGFATRFFGIAWL
ncbi:hypothetical protein CC85DRAFT_283622 [Cutaneotrichosporon oleaginosum]|uniref:Uncharacterized protein n=1 Tax=Cutaneotrichosporon oleaginosum TaxID=879819 RepID=A0A0J0XTF4_9TREE|nr:uncharacterized protein CC85DRAFT_283622 [Cutaneotrichosporon oleaginosum]KLT44383.1 hypothetical protein CC85DRAFT_283622 [Cutaneotrichosporon oleaginosum]TXT07894.1 hypothetical protein COLE_04818 [Cutaneotrichosporon oleaginosum]